MSVNQLRQRKTNELARDTKNIAKLYLQGLQQAEIGEMVGLDQSQVSRHISKIREEWLEDAKRDVAERTAEILQQYQQIYADSYEAWRKRQTPGHLRNALQALQSISRLFGMDKVNISVKADIGLSSVNIHRQISDGDMAAAMAELSQWENSFDKPAELPTASTGAPQRLKSGKQDSIVAEQKAEFGHSVASEAIVPEPSEAVKARPEREILDPNSPDFPLTI